MSLKFRIGEQVLSQDEKTDLTEAVVHKYDAFLNLLCAGPYKFQRRAVQAAVRFLVSSQCANLEALARANWEVSEAIRQKHETIDLYLSKMPLRDVKAASLDLATGTGKSFVMYAIAAIALAEGIADRVLILCPSLTIEQGLLEKFGRLVGNSELSTIMKELGAIVPIPSIKRGDTTIRSGDICIENIHAVYENTGTSIRDSFHGSGGKALVLNDEAHHLFSPPDRELKEWMRFLQHPDFGFQQIVNVTGTPYVGDEYFPDVIFRYGLKEATADKVVKKINYKISDTYTAHDWAKTYAIHQKNRKEYGGDLKPISIVVTQEIAKCVEVWRELVKFLAKKEGTDAATASAKAIWVTSGVPSSGSAKSRVSKAFLPRFDKDSPERQRRDNLNSLGTVDAPSSPVEWIVSVSMLSEGWDVKNVFQVVPHESRAFSSKLLISQVLGRGLRVPQDLPSQPFLTINNHEAWSEEVGNLLNEVLEVENTLSWGFDARRKEFVFPLHNLAYRSEQTGIEVKRETARAPEVVFRPQSRRSTEYSTFSSTGNLSVEIEHGDIVEVDMAVTRLSLFIRGKNEALAANWPRRRLKELVVSRLKSAGQETSFLSKENFLILQQGFGPMFRELDTQHPRLGQTAQDITHIDLSAIPRQSFSEDMLKERGAIWVARETRPPYGGHELSLWEQYQRLRAQFVDYGSEASDQAQSIGSRILEVDLGAFRSPWNIHYVTHEPERRFSELLFQNAVLFRSFVKMPALGGYSFPYSYKPSKAAKTHVANEHFSPDFFLRLAGGHDIVVVEIKDDGDDSNQNRAKCRDGLKHFETLNNRLHDTGEPWRYHFFFLSPEDFTKFFDQLRNGSFATWRSGLMNDLSA